METIDKVKERIVKKYEELQTYSTTYNAKAKAQREQLMNDYKEAFQKDPSSVNLTDIAKDMFYLNGFHQADIRKLQIQLLDIYTFSKDIFPELELPKEIDTTITILKGNLPKQIFISEDGKLKEIEKGKVDELTKEYQEKNYFKFFETQLNTILNA